MHYLECIQMLDYLLGKLHAKERVQVPISVLEDLITVISAVKEKLENETNPMLKARMDDILSCYTIAKEKPNLTNLTEDMKLAIVSGLLELRSETCILAYSYFQVNDFEPTPQIITIMRSVVECAIERGVLNVKQ